MATALGMRGRLFLSGPLPDQIPDIFNTPFELVDEKADEGLVNQTLDQIRESPTEREAHEDEEESAGLATLGSVTFVLVVLALLIRNCSD